MTATTPWVPPIGYKACVDALRYLRSITLQPITFPDAANLPGYELRLNWLAIPDMETVKTTEPFVIAESDLLEMIELLREQVRQVQAEQGRLGH